jgi:hypothetical protein
LPEKDVFELDHAGIGEQQGRIVARDERTGRNDAVPVAFKELQESIAYFVDFHPIQPITKLPACRTAGFRKAWLGFRMAMTVR